jgi:hypothetical protein
MGREVQRGAERGAERCEITQIRTHKKSTHNTYIANLTEITLIQVTSKGMLVFHFTGSSRAIAQQSSCHSNPLRVSGSMFSPGCRSRSKEHSARPAGC